MSEPYLHLHVAPAQRIHGALPSKVARAADHECRRERDSRDVERPSILIKLSALRIDVYMFTTLPICKGDSPP